MLSQPAGRLRGIGPGGRDDIERGIVRQLPLAKNSAEVRVQIRRVEEVMMRQLRINTVQPKMQDDARAGRFEASHLLHHGCR